jgi:hypothetical protein
MTNNMKNQNCVITPAGRKHLETQGYLEYIDVELDDFKFGIRFPFYLCGAIVALGLLGLPRFSEQVACPRGDAFQTPQG